MSKRKWYWLFLNTPAPENPPNPPNPPPVIKNVRVPDEHIRDIILLYEKCECERQPNGSINRVLHYDLWNKLETICPEIPNTGWCKLIFVSPTVIEVHYKEKE